MAMYILTIEEREREGKGREGKGREGKGREGKGRERLMPEKFLLGSTCAYKVYSIIWGN